MNATATNPDGSASLSSSTVIEAVESLRSIAADHNCIEGAIYKKSKKESLARDLDPKVKAKAEELVRKNEVRKTVRATEATESMQISVAAA